MIQYGKMFTAGNLDKEILTLINIEGLKVFTIQPTDYLQYIVFTN